MFFLIFRHYNIKFKLEMIIYRNFKKIYANMQEE
jgi:hypothetical protein